jgi:hypothetical protein
VIKYFILNVKLTGTVEIDEAVITSRRRGFIGRIPSKIIWVFGLYSRNQKLVYIMLVPNRRADTLIPIISALCSEGCELLSDEFLSYVTPQKQSRILERLPEKNFTHYWVNHSHTFVNPYWPSIHINNMENEWSKLRQYVKRNMP